ncbi:MAG TPA: metallophosphoesterase family protein [Polyangiaceae bacterium]
MQLAVISDLHLGAGDCSDAFGHDDASFLRFLGQLESDFERIVLLGDVWETLTSARPFDCVGALRAAKEAHPAIARRFLRPCYKYIHGNHDLIAAKVDNAPEEWSLNVDGLRLVFAHGHHHDWLIRKARWLSEFCVWMGAWARRLRLDAIYRIGYCLDSWATRMPDDLTIGSFQRWALSLASSRAADIVVTGHTHISAIERYQQKLFLNSGSCSEGRLSYLAIDTKLHQFDLCETTALA